MPYMTVYDPDGNLFEVSPRKAKELVVYKGWTFSKEKDVEVFASVPEALVLDKDNEWPKHVNVEKAAIVSNSPPVGTVENVRPTAKNEVEKDADWHGYEEPNEIKVPNDKAAKARNK